MNNFKNKYIKYKKKYLALKKGGSTTKNVYYHQSEVYNEDDRKLKCNELKTVPDYTKAKYCGTRENRVKCINKEEDYYRFEQQEYNMEIIPSNFNYYECVNDVNIEKTNFGNKTINKSSIVIFGGGPVGLFTAIYAIEKNMLGNVIVIENRENYSRNQDVVLLKSVKYATVSNLNKIPYNNTTLLNDMIQKKIICVIDPPITHVAICKKIESNIEDHNYLVKIKELENYFEQVFLNKGGKIIRSKLAKKKIISKFENKDNSISITINNGPLYNTSSKKIIYNNITITNISHLLCCDGGRPSSRKQLSNLFGKKEILEYVLFDKKGEHKAYLGTIEKKNVIHEKKNVIHEKKNVIHENNNEHFVSYGVACNILIEEKIVDAIMKQSEYKNKQKHIRFFIPYGNSNYTIEKNGIKYIKAYLGIQIKIITIRTLESDKIAKTFHKSLYKTRDKNKITEIFEIIDDITSVANTIDSILGNAGYNFRDNIMPNCYHISVFPIQLYTANEYLINENKTKIAFIGDATFGVHFFSGTGVNIGMSFGKHIIDYFNNDNSINIKEKYDTFKKDVKIISSNFILD